MDDSQGEFFNHGTNQDNEIKAPSCCKGKEGGSCSQVTKQDEELEAQGQKDSLSQVMEQGSEPDAPSPCEGDTVSTNTCCATVKKTYQNLNDNKPCADCNAPESCSQSEADMEICCAPVKEVETQKTTRSCGSDKKETYCSLRKQIDGNINVHGERGSESNIAAEKPKPASSSCSQNEIRGERESKDVKVDCSKRKENTVLLIAPSEKQVSPTSSVAAKTEEPPVQRQIITKLRVLNICCSMEVQLVEECLKPLEGVENIAVNVIGRVVYVRHDPDKTSQTDLVESLNRVHLGVTVMETGDHHDKDQENVPFGLKLLFIYVFIQTVLLATALTGLFLNHSWYMWVAITEVVFGGAPILKNAVFSVKNLNIDINILILIAVIGTLAIGEWVEGAIVVCIFAFADVLQEFCMFRVRRSISRLMLKRPNVAVLAATGESVPIENVAVGTLIAVRPGELIPLDGVVVKGNAAVDESSITGESLPVEKTVSSKVYSGTVNQNGYIEVETTSDSSSSTVSKVTQMVQEAQSSSTKTEEIINRFAKYYTPLVVLVAALVVIVPAILGASGVGSYLQDIREWGRRALVMLVIACPCALVMSTPIAVVCSITEAARKGALVKGGEHLETVSKLKVVAFDKTGTLTEGKFQVMHMECAYGENERDVLRLAAGLESKTVHPIAAAIVNEFSGCVTEMVKNQIDNFPVVSQFKLYEGQGISGLIEGKLVRVGNKEMVEQCGATLNETMAEKYELWSNESNTVVFICVDEKLVLMIGLADAIRPNTSITLDWLRNIGIQTCMLTGDNSRTAEAVRSNLGLDECVSGMKPHEKLAWIQQKQCKSAEQDSFLSSDEEDQTWKCCRPTHDDYVTVGMVGDGVNDGPALASANVGIAMGAGGTALAVDAADVALMSNNLASIPELISLAKFCNHIVKQNIVFSVLLKICIVIVALLGYVTLWMAVVVDVVGLLFVIMNGLRPLISVELFDCLIKPKGWERVE